MCTDPVAVRTSKRRQSPRMRLRYSLSDPDNGRRNGHAGAEDRIAFTQKVTEDMYKTQVTLYGQSFSIVGHVVNFFMPQSFKDYLAEN